MAFLHGIEVVEVADGLRPVGTVSSSIIGLIGTADDADAGKFPLNTPVLVTGPRGAADLGAAGTLKDAVNAVFAQTGAIVVIVRVAEGLDENESFTNLVGDATAGTGINAFLSAAAVVKVTPRILCAPGWTSQRPGALANPLVAGLIGVADKLRAVVVADAPGTASADAITYRQDFDSDRLYVVEPHVMAWDAVAAASVAKPASGYVAGIIARQDNERGFWHSPSNQPVYGITGAARPIGFALSDQASEANLLNENEVAAIVNIDGWRLWGNRVAASDAQWAFLSVRRTADIIYDSIERAHLWAMDKPFSANLISDIQETVDSYLRQLKALGAILGGKVWLDPELNTQAALMAGELWLDFDIEPPAPLERLTFRAHREAGYYEELVESVQAA